MQYSSVRVAIMCIKRGAIAKYARSEKDDFILDVLGAMIYGLKP